VNASENPWIHPYWLGNPSGLEPDDAAEPECGDETLAWLASLAPGRPLWDDDLDAGSTWSPLAPDPVRERARAALAGVAASTAVLTAALAGLLAGPGALVLTVAAGVLGGLAGAAWGSLTADPWRSP
jgi:hypothetical protein